jgi:hypothetical protein
LRLCRIAKVTPLLPFRCGANARDCASTTQVSVRVIAARKRFDFNPDVLVFMIRFAWVTHVEICEILVRSTSNITPPSRWLQHLVTWLWATANCTVPGNLFAHTKKIASVRYSVFNNCARSRRKLISELLYPSCVKRTRPCPAVRRSNAASGT